MAILDTNINIICRYFACYKQRVYKEYNYYTFELFSNNELTHLEYSLEYLWKILLNQFQQKTPHKVFQDAQPKFSFYENPLSVSMHCVQDLINV